MSVESVIIGSHWADPRRGLTQRKGCIHNEARSTFTNMEAEHSRDKYLKKTTYLLFFKNQQVLSNQVLKVMPVLNSDYFILTFCESQASAYWSLDHFFPPEVLQTFKFSSTDFDKIPGHLGQSYHTTTFWKQRWRIAAGRNTFRCPFTVSVSHLSSGKTLAKKNVTALHQPETDE